MSWSEWLQSLGSAVLTGALIGRRPASPVIVSRSAAPGIPGQCSTPVYCYRLQQRYGDTKPATLEGRTDLTPALIRAVVRLGLPIMPPLRKTEVNDAELDALIAYLTRAKGT